MRWKGAVLIVAGSGLVLAGWAAPGASAADRGALTVTRPVRPPPPLVVPSPALPGAPIPWSGSPVLTPQTLSIVDAQTRFLTAGPAEARCPGEPVIFVPGVVNPFRPTAPGDGAFMCRSDAVREGFVGP